MEILVHHINEICMVWPKLGTSCKLKQSQRHCWEDDYNHLAVLLERFCGSQRAHTSQGHTQTRPEAEIFFHIGAPCSWGMQNDSRKAAASRKLRVLGRLKEEYSTNMIPDISLTGTRSIP